MHQNIERNVTPAPKRQRLVAAMMASSFLLLSGCSIFSNKEEVKAPKVASAETLYNYGIDALHSKRYTLASGEFELLQQNYPIPAMSEMRN